MSFSDFLRKDLRLVILRILNDMPAYRANSSVLSNVLHQFGHTATRDQVKAELRWLEEIDCVSIEEAGSVLVATLKERGQNAAEGKTVIDGIARPRAH
ncbi:MAG: ArsR family transcriptional regulator [Rhodocyclaceae bacterium]|nr:ArsR family transcriptional regulator [Rhodocyclaceae bacterium]